MACRHPLSRRRRRDTQGTALSRAIDGRIGTITDAPLPYDTPFTQLALSTLDPTRAKLVRMAVVDSGEGFAEVVG
jgi:hypothetical protein